MAEDFGEDLFNVFDQNEVTKVSPLDTPIVDKSDEQR